MKTGITVIKDVQVSMDDYKCVKTTKVFDDNATILEIKTWIKLQLQLKSNIKDFGIADVDISNIYE